MGARERRAETIVSPMDFDLTEEQRSIRETLTDFAEREIRQHSTKWDQEEFLPRHASEEHREHYVASMLKAEKIGAWCLTESSSGSDAAAMHTKATRAGDNYTINGSKMFITNGSIGDVFVVMAMTDTSKGRDGVSA